MAWDTDNKGNVTAVPLRAFEVAAYPEDRVVLLRLEIANTQVQLALNPDYAASLARDLADAASKVAQVAASSHNH
jgi:hypothetical protein